MKVLLGTLLAGLVVGCAVEEPESSGALSVDPNSNEVEVPDWVTAAYLDLNKDGTIDIKDLVIMSKFFGQDVAEADAVAEASDADDPCIEIGKAEPYSNPKVDTVEDNTDFKKTFDAPDENVYVYALLAMAKSRNTKSKSPPESEIPQYDTPSCVAIRFMFDKNLLPKEVKVKPVAGHENMFSKTITSPTINKEGRKWRESGGVWAAWIGDEWHFRLLRDFGANNWMKHDEMRMKRQIKKGIPISESSVIHKLRFPVKEGDSYETFYHLTIWSMPNPIPFERSQMGYDKGAYVKMLPAEVRRRYFPEDIE